jgi:hypothetical protein
MILWAKLYIRLAMSGKQIVYTTLWYRLQDPYSFGHPLPSKNERSKARSMLTIHWLGCVHREVFLGETL